MPERLRAHVFKLAFRLRRKGSFSSGSQQIARSFEALPEWALPSRDRGHPLSKNLPRATPIRKLRRTVTSHEPKAAGPLVKLQTGIGINLRQLRTVGDMAESESDVGLVNGLAGHKLIRMRRSHRRAGCVPGADSGVLGEESLAEAELRPEGAYQDSLGRNETVAFGEFTPTHF